jgi:ribosomal protein S18 acetylase RimI-like enzyme
MTDFNPERPEIKPDNILLEKATEADLEDSIALENKVASTTYVPLGDKNQLLELMAKGPIYKIKKGEELAGIVAYYTKEDGSIYIDALATDPKYRGQHLGQEAMIKILQEIKDTPKIWLVTHPDNAAVKLYESLGFTITDRKENYFGDGEPRLILTLIHATE